jgi:hypothetical protein
MVFCTRKGVQSLHSIYTCIYNILCRLVVGRFDRYYICYCEPKMSLHCCSPEYFVTVNVLSCLLNRFHFKGIWKVSRIFINSTVIYVQLNSSGFSHKTILQYFIYIPACYGVTRLCKLFLWNKEA